MPAAPLPLPEAPGGERRLMSQPRAPAKSPRGTGSFGRFTLRRRSVRGGGFLFGGRFGLVGGPCFFSRRRRHTTLTCDWSSDVCSSDLVVILLLLCLPFSFALERLVFGSTSVYRQIAGFGGVFLATFAILYATHPAFSLASAPVIV